MIVTLQLKKSEMNSPLAPVFLWELGLKKAILFLEFFLLYIGLVVGFSATPNSFQKGG